jgi:hypothetical protein
LFVVAITIQTSQGLLFDTRELTEREKQIAEKDYLSIVEKCYGRLEAKEDSGEMCDAFFAYYLNQCAALDNLLSYCDIDYYKNNYVNPVRDYEFTRYNQQGCIKQNQTFMDLVFCEDYINIPGEAERRFLKTLTNKSHLIIPSATLYTTDYNSEIFGEVMNNYTYPIEFTHILAGFNYTNGSAVDFDHVFTQDSIIKPGHKSGFWFFFENPLPKNTRFTLTSEFQRSNVSLPGKLLLTVTNPGNRMSNHTPIGTTDAIQTDSGKISGNITNLGNLTASNVQINAIFYDASGKVVDIDSEYVNIGIGLLPRKSQSFSMQPLLNYEYMDKVVSYQLNAESREYSSK